jgi:hypothetical protein
MIALPVPFLKLFMNLVPRDKNTESVQQGYAVVISYFVANSCHPLFNNKRLLPYFVLNPCYVVWDGKKKKEQQRKFVQKFFSTNTEVR